MDLFPKRHKLVHKGGFQNFDPLSHSKNTTNQQNSCKTLVMGYYLPNYKFQVTFNILKGNFTQNTSCFHMKGLSEC